MTERAKKVSELVALTNVPGASLLMVVDQPGTANAATKKVTLTSLMANVSVNTVFTQNTTIKTLYFSNTTNTPANSSATGAQGEVRVDSSYIYVCVANNTWKRSAITNW
jgi:hypothetical protein